MASDLTGKAVVLGLDGATWDLLVPLAERGIMPNLARALEQGRHGRLQSCLPPYSSPAWMSISTGKNPGSHGIFDFWEAGLPGERRLVSSRSARGKKLWELVDAAGRVAHVVAVPVSYPPPQLERGTFVCGMFTPGESVDYTWPPELKARAEGAARRLPRRSLRRRPAGSAVHRADALRDPPAGGGHQPPAGQGRLGPAVLGDPGAGSDPAQVLERARSRPTRATTPPRRASTCPALEESYRRCDEVIGDRLAMAERGAFVMVVSDHGFGRFEKNFYLNAVLEQHGLLFRQKSAKKVASKRLSTRSVIDTLRKLDVVGLEGRVPQRFRERLGRGIDSALSVPIDRDRTLAYAAASSAESVFISAHVPDDQRDAVAARVIEALESARDPDTGEPIIVQALRREDVYDGSELDRIPDILIDFGEHPYVASDRLAASSIVERLPAAAGGGRHRRYGILLALGPGVTAGEIDGANIVDLAPTALHAMGLPVPDDMDGRVLTELFTDGRQVQTADAAGSETSEVVYTPEEEAAIQASLENLGYM